MPRRRLTAIRSSTAKSGEKLEGMTGFQYCEAGFGFFLRGGFGGNAFEQFLREEADGGRSVEKAGQGTDARVV